MRIGGADTGEETGAKQLSATTRLAGAQRNRHGLQARKIVFGQGLTTAQGLPQVPGAIQRENRR
jgi:hypothetical protein